MGQEALLLEFQHRGLTVIAILLPDEAREELQLNNLICLDLDVTSEESVQMLRKSVDNLTGGRLDVLVNNAGICYTMTAIDMNVKKVQAMFDVNAFGPMRIPPSAHQSSRHYRQHMISGRIGSVYIWLVLQR